jgi:hypothetical protein
MGTSYAERLDDCLAYGYNDTAQPDYVFSKKPEGDANRNYLDEANYLDACVKHFLNHGNTAEPCILAGVRCYPLAGQRGPFRISVGTMQKICGHPVGSSLMAAKFDARVVELWSYQDKDSKVEMFDSTILPEVPMAPLPPLDFSTVPTNEVSKH